MRLLDKLAVLLLIMTYSQKKCNNMSEKTYYKYKYFII